MKIEFKTWAGLGLATALAGAGLSGCSDNAETVEEADASAVAGEMGEGEGGESGEGGVAIEDAARDPVVYGSALAVAEAHAIAARDAFAVGKADAAAEMFAHPVSEVLLDMDPILTERGVKDFKPLFSDASAAILDGADQTQVDANFEAIIAALRGAAAKGPDNGTSDAAIAAGITADQVDRAISMYVEASQSDRYEPYLDGYGFFKAAQTAFEGSSGAIKAENADLHASLTTALSLLGTAYPSAERPASLDVNQGELLGAASRVQLSL